MSLSLCRDLIVSRETIEKLEALAAKLAKWTPAINLVAKSTVGSAWERHIVDSAQLYRTGPFRIWGDLGSGGGFPGLVVAVLAAELSPESRVILVEADQRKATFLREAIRQLHLSAIVHAERIEKVLPLGVDVLSARALAPLATLCTYADRHLAPDGTAIFPKGSAWRSEVEEARKYWNFDLAVEPSETDPSAVVLQLKAIRHV